MDLLRKRSLEELKSASASQSMKKTLNAIDLTFIGIGAIVGVGVFVTTGKAAANMAGPSVIISFILAGIICIFTAFAYAELAAMIPVSGGVYSYAYVSMGEIIAWLIGCSMMMLYIFGGATVAGGWSGYVTGVLEQAGMPLPQMLTNIPAEGGIINLPAALIVFILSLFLIVGTNTATKLNSILVFIKIAVLIVFCMAAFPYADTKYLADFMPYGFDGIIAAAGNLFFAYAGFDVIATSAEECKKPNRDLPIGIIGSLLICILIYVISSTILVSVVEYTSLNTAEPMAYVLRVNGSNLGSKLVATGAIVSLTTVLMMLIYGLSRILFSMSRDGMVPKLFSKLHKKFSTPHLSLMLISLVLATIAGFLPVEMVSDLTSMSTIVSLIAVSVAVLIMRVKHPEFHRPFKCPYVFVIAPIALISCSILLVGLIGRVGPPFAIGMLVGLAIYFSYGYWHSVAGKNKKEAAHNQNKHLM